MTVKGLSDQDIRILQKLVDANRHLFLANDTNKTTTEHSFAEGEDHQAPELYLAKPQDAAGLPGITLATGTASTDYDVPGFGICDLYKIIEDTPGSPIIVPMEGGQKPVYNVGAAAAQALMVIARLKNGRWIPIMTSLPFVGFILDENHPGRGIPFDVLVGKWNVDTLQWDYTEGAATAIDWRYGVPYPDVCATGLGFWMPATDLGTGAGTGGAAGTRIIEVWALDCTSPGC